MAIDFSGGIVHNRYDRGKAEERGRVRENVEVLLWITALMNNIYREAAKRPYLAGYPANIPDH